MIIFIIIIFFKNFMLIILLFTDKLKSTKTDVYRSDIENYFKLFGHEKIVLSFIIVSMISDVRLLDIFP